MITILRGSFFRHKEIEVPSGRVDLRPPKIIVGISLTLVGEYAFPHGAVTLPAILDTGFNRTLEIDEWHLVKWAGLRKEHLKSIAKDRLHEGRKYDLCAANCSAPQNSDQCIMGVETPEEAHCDEKTAAIHTGV